MSKNLHDTDDFFKNAYDHYGEDPSAEVWDKLKATLDEQDADKYKRKFVGWKRVAVILLILIGGVAAYELGMQITQNGGHTIVHSNTAENGQTIVKDSDKPPVQNKVAPHNVKITADPAEKNNPSSLAATTAIPAEDNNNIISVQPKILPEKPIITSKHNNNRYYKNTAGNSTSVDAGFISSNTNTYIFSVQGKRESVDLNTVSTYSTVPVLNTMEIKPLFHPAANSTQAVKKPAYHFKPYWELNASAFGELSQYHLDNDEENNTGNLSHQKDDIHRREKHEGSFSTGIFISRQQTKHLGLKTGLIFASTVITIAPQELYAAQESGGTVAYKYIASSGYGYVKPSFGTSPAIGDSIKSNTAQHNLKSLSIPLMISYKMYKGKFSITPSAGASINFITKATLETEITDALNKEHVIINKLEGMRKFYLGFAGEINVAYNYSKRWAINVIPGIRYAFTPITKNNVVKTYPYSLFAGGGITYRF